MKNVSGQPIIHLECLFICLLIIIYIFASGGGNLETSHSVLWSFFDNFISIGKAGYFIPQHPILSPNLLKYLSLLNAI